MALSQLWTAAAVTRRTTESAGTTTEPSPLAATDTTSEPAAHALAAEAVSLAAVKNSLTYTAGPSLFDQITVAVLRVMRAVSDVIGVDLFGEGGKLIVTATPPAILTYGLHVEKTTYTAADGEVWRVWELTPDNPTGKAVVALHGGGFILQPNVMHCFDYTNMARATGATVIVPLYPLATTEAGSAVRLIPTTADFISQQIDRFGAENVSIYADSSGANLAMVAVREMILRGDELPSDIVLVSLGPDGTLSNPDIATIDDPVFNINNLDFYANGNHWGDGLSDDDPRLNELLFEDAVLQAFPQTTIYQGSLEFSLPDVKLLHQRAVDLGAPISVVIGKGQIHDWALGFPINSQALAVRKDIYRQLGLTGIHSNTITYTAAPSLTDIVTVFVLRVMRAVSNILGFDIYGEIGKLMANSNPQPFMLGGLNAVKTTYTTAEGEVWKVWEFSPPNPSGKAVIAVHGGGFILEPILTHWIDYTNMARDTGATVIVPIYPLATTEKGAATVVVPAMADFVTAQIDRFGAENVSMYADSAGPSLALGAVRLLILRGDPLPASMVMLSFAPDATLSNPDAYTIDDPVVDLSNLDFYATVNHWGDGLADKDPLISPMFYEPEVLAALPPTMIYVGELEFMLPDTLLFQQKAVAAGGTMSVVVGRGQIHDWALGAPVNSQSSVVRWDIYRELGLTHTAPPTLFDQLATAVTRLVTSVTDSVTSVVLELATSITRLFTPVVDSVTSLVLDVVSALTRIVTGPPILPPDSTVKVGTSSLKITDTMTVPANWYFPEGYQPPDHMILLQHGFLATGPMYSYTAARLAESTHSIVVTPTLTSNYLAPGGNGTPGSGLWLGGDAMHAVLADLFVGDRAALTASALDAGYAVQYGLDRQEAVLPRRFGLVGHSAGGALVSGVAGFVTENGAADDLVGVIMLDGVPTGDQLPGALRKLAAYEELTGRYIPIREIGAPTNQFNQAGNAKQALTAARPDHFNGVVLAGGAHTDSIQGGNKLIQFVLYLAAGFPRPQNPPGVQILMADWFNEWFDGDVTAGDDLAPGSTLLIDTPKGVATGTVIRMPAPVSV